MAEKKTTVKKTAAKAQSAKTLESVVKAEEKERVKKTADAVKSTTATKTQPEKSLS